MLENALIAALFLLCFIIPVIIVARRAARKKNNVLKNTLENAAADHQLKINHAEAIGNRMLGWDDEQHTLLYLGNQQEPVLVLPLSNGHRCAFSQDVRNGAVHQMMLLVVDKHGRVLEQLPFFRKFLDNEMKLTGMTEQVKAWEASINQKQAARKVAA